MRGQITFDYTSNRGIAEIGTGDAHFATRWSGASNKSICALSNGKLIAVARAADAASISDIKDAARFDYSSDHQTINEGEIALVRNDKGMYAALKVRDVKARSHGDALDQVTFDFVILEDRSRDFSQIKPMSVIDGSFAKRVLLIGAGFSCNWGGLTATDLSGRLMAHPAVRARPRLPGLLVAEPSFEDALEKTRTGLYEEADNEALEIAIKAAFDDMDAGYKNPAPPVLGATINDFLGRFCPGPVGIGTGYVFSLNQDLLLERIYGIIVTRQKLITPGIKWLDRPPHFPAGANPIPLASPVDPGATEPDLLKNFNHVKLHGSINWRTDDGKASMVMGRRKQLTISSSALIGWYHRVLESVLNSGDVRLMVIGYGWGDEHINEPIADAVLNHGLTIYSWNPQHPRDMLKGKHRGDDILKGVTLGYISRTMREVMPHNPMNPRTADYEAIVRDFF